MNVVLLQNLLAFNFLNLLGKSDLVEMMVRLIDYINHFKIEFNIKIYRENLFSMSSES